MYKTSDTFDELTKYIYPQFYKVYIVHHAELYVKVVLTQYLF